MSECRKSEARESSSTDLGMIGALEDASDLEDVRAALADPANRARIGWDALKAQLGL